jgi:hypothetical protein
VCQEYFSLRNTQQQIVPAIEPAKSHIACCDMIRDITYKGSATFSNTIKPLLQRGQVQVRVDRLSSVDIHKDRGDEARVGDVDLSY